MSEEKPAARTGARKNGACVTAAPEARENRVRSRLDTIVFWAMLGAGAASFCLLTWPDSAFAAAFGVLALRIAREDLAFMIVPDADLALLFSAGVLHDASTPRQRRGP